MRRARRCRRISRAGLGSLAFQIVVVTFASYLVWFWLIRHYPATRLASFTMLTPVFGLLLGALLLAEPITARLLVALATVAAGIFLVNRKTHDRASLTTIALRLAGCALRRLGRAGARLGAGAGVHGRPSVGVVPGASR